MKTKGGKTLEMFKMQALPTNRCTNTKIPPITARKENLARKISCLLSLRAKSKAGELSRVRAGRRCARRALPLAALVGFARMCVRALRRGLLVKLSPWLYHRSS